MSDKKYVLISANGVTIDTTIYDSFKEAKKEMTDEYELCEYVVHATSSRIMHDWAYVDVDDKTVCMWRIIEV